MMANGNSSINGPQKSGFPNKINLELLQTNTSNKPLNQGKIQSSNQHHNILTTDEISNHANVEKTEEEEEAALQVLTSILTLKGLMLLCQSSSTNLSIIIIRMIFKNIKKEFYEDDDYDLLSG